jgi:hypothetical protein
LVLHSNRLSRNHWEMGNNPPPREKVWLQRKESVRREGRVEVA